LNGREKVVAKNGPFLDGIYPNRGFDLGATRNLQNYFITGYPIISAQTPTVKLSPLEAVSFYFSSAQRAEQVRH
jgi:hypothetical protein